MQKKFSPNTKVQVLNLIEIYLKIYDPEVETLVVIPEGEHLARVEGEKVYLQDVPFALGLSQVKILERLE